MYPLVEIIDILDFKSSILHRSFMENIFLVKLPANVNQRKHIHNNFLSEVSHVLNYTFFSGE